MNHVQALVDLGERGKVVFSNNSVRFLGVEPALEGAIRKYIKGGEWQTPLVYDPFPMETIVDKVAEKFNGRIRIRPKPSTADVPDGVVF